MVKQLNIILDDKDHEKLVRAKGDKNWRDFVMSLTKKDVKDEKK